jgi:two-component system sensor histidine kinase EvgS
MEMAREEAWLLENPVIRVAHDPGWVPIEYADESGRIAGVTAKYMAEVEKATGADLVGAGSTSWSHALEQLQNREADIAFMIADTPERSEYLGFTTPHYTVSQQNPPVTGMSAAADKAFSHTGAKRAR